MLHKQTLRSSKHRRDMAGIGNICVVRLQARVVTSRLFTVIPLTPADKRASAKEATHACLVGFLEGL